MNVLKSWPDVFSAHAATALKNLIEERHLYQSVKIELSGFGSQHPDLSGQPWRFSNQISLGEVISIQPSDVKTFCRKCDRLEPFNFVGATILAQGGVTTTFTLSYVCQSCKDLAEVFLIRREGARIRLCGRAPMEAVQVPPVVPKAVERFYSAAVVAYQSGQHLPAVFMLRTVLEQWARHKVGSRDEDTRDDVIERYMASVPTVINEKFPSVRGIYSDLSAAIHSADASEALYVDASARLIKHFDARRVFELDDSPFIPGSQAPGPTSL